ncbi:hypothetical protein SAMN05192574_101212 [Mucilaginibacter gossypiicola]|uniref:Uncharacterized protein n=1 Tax=Mucilaginibacter gossypiicola TaxID=551995 RepID=A0A1H7ZUQ9_9SPHI|nr:hypothetical protein SAMN05192574_101212 [Mucilaginibacter gossypiicola]
MRSVSLGKRILCLFIAIGYFFFSCLYVTRCPKAAGHTKTGAYFIANNHTKQSNTVISSATNSKSIPVLFLTRPRVVFGKNLVPLTNQFRLIRVFELCPFRCITKNDIEDRFRAHKIFYTANIFSIIRTWKI